MKKTVEALIFTTICSLFFFAFLLTVVWIFYSRAPAASEFIPLAPIPLLLLYIIAGNRR